MAAAGSSAGYPTSAGTTTAWRGSATFAGAISRSSEWEPSSHRGTSRPRRLRRAYVSGPEASGSGRTDLPMLAPAHPSVPVAGLAPDNDPATATASGDLLATDRPAGRALGGGAGLGCRRWRRLGLAA